MAGYEALTSLRNQRVKEVLRLRQRRQRDRTGRMLIEGRREIRAAIASGVRIATLFVCEELLGPEDEDIIKPARRGGAEIVTVNTPVAAKMAYRNNPEGLLALAEQPGLGIEGIRLRSPALVAVLEGIEKPGNLGAALRVADGAGIDGLVVAGGGTDVWNPNTIRSSLGTVFSVPIARTGAREALDWCKNNGLCIVAATPGAEMMHWDADLSLPAAIAVGSEDIGLSGLWMEAADIRVRIPMRGTADSLNASASLAILLYEALRQRGSPADGSRLHA